MNITENEVSFKIRGAIFNVYNALGPGLPGIKSVEKLIPLRHKQLLTYLRLTKKRLGLWVNFNSDNIAENIHRIANNLK